MVPRLSEMKPRFRGTIQQQQGLSSSEVAVRAVLTPLPESSRLVESFERTCRIVSEEIMFAQANERGSRPRALRRCWMQGMWPKTGGYRRRGSRPRRDPP